MFNGLDRPVRLLNLRYGRESRKALCLAKHYSLTIKENWVLFLYLILSILLFFQFSIQTPIFNLSYPKNNEYSLI
jgi:hypothetical protein